MVHNDPFSGARDQTREDVASGGDDGLSEAEERDVIEGIGGPGSRTGPGDPDPIDRDSDRDDDRDSDDGGGRDRGPRTSRGEPSLPRAGRRTTAEPEPEPEPGPMRDELTGSLGGPPAGARQQFGDGIRQERFGELDFSFGLGAPGDDVERFLREESEQFQQFAREDIGGREPPDIPIVGPDFRTEQRRAAAETQGRLASRLDPFAAGVGAIETAEAAAFLAEPVVSGDLERARRRGRRLGRAGAAAGEQAAEFAVENPGLAAEEVATGLALGTAGGRAAGAAGRVARGRVRTAGGTRIDAEELVNRETLDVAEGRSTDPSARFPGAQDPDLFEADQARAIREQAEEFTPDPIAERFDEAGAEGTDLTKALADEPGGPGRGRSAQGFEAPDVDDELARQFETPGTSFGPELSPNFLRLGDRTPDFSLRPGLPDIGGRPTGVLARTEVIDTDAPDVEAFSRELVEARGDPRARTLPPDEATPGEAEVIVPPGAQFRDIGGSPTRNLLRRAGVGSDFFTEIGGRRVPLRTVVPDRPDSGPDVAPDVDIDLDAGDDLAGTSRGAPAFTERTLSELSSPVRPRTERPSFAPVSGDGPTMLNETVGSTPDMLRDGGIPSMDETRPPTIDRRRRPDGERRSRMPPMSESRPPVFEPERSMGGGRSGGGESSSPSSPTPEESSVTQPTSPPSSGGPGGGSSGPSPGRSGGATPPSSPPGGGSPGGMMAPPSGPPSAGVPADPPVPSEFDADDGDDRRRFRFLLESDLERTFSSSVATSESVLAGDLESIEAEPATSMVTDADATPRIASVRGRPPSGFPSDDTNFEADTEIEL